MLCPCQSGKNLDACCGPFVAGNAFPPTAEALMRSRYTAYVQKNIGYLKTSLSAESKVGFDEKATKEWASKVTWYGLKVGRVEDGGVDDRTGVVEFLATYEEDGERFDHHEVSQFKKDSKGHWVFVEGDSHTHREGEDHHHHHHDVKPQPLIRQAPKVGRNDPCPCGSGKKFKKCHGA